MRRALRILRDLWIYFKTGHSKYLTFFLGVLNFIVLQYRFVISAIPAFSSVVGSLTAFTVLFLVTYIPAAVLLGRFEYAKGELTRTPLLNPYAQDSIISGLLFRDAFSAHFEGDDDEARKLMALSCKILEKWEKKGRV